LKKIVYLLIFILFSCNVFAAITDKLEAVWTFESAAANESLGRHGYFGVNTPTYTAGKNGNALTLDGTNQYILLSQKLSGTNDAFTLNFWINSDVTTGNKYPIEFGNGGAAYLTFGWYGSASTWITWYPNNAQPDFGYNFIKNPPKVGTWEMITIVYNTTGDYFYWNGVLNRTDLTSIPASVTWDANYYSIGTMRNSDITRYWDGQIDEMYFWNRSITQAEITSLYGGSFYPFTASSTVNFTSDTTQTGSYFQNWIYYNITNLTSPASSNVTLWKDGLVVYSASIGGTFPYAYNITTLSYGTYILNATNTSQSYNINLNYYNTSFTTNTTQNGTKYQNWIFAELSSNSTNVYNNLSIWNSSNYLINSTNTTSYPFRFNFTNLAYGIYKLNSSNSTQSFNITLVKNLFGTTKFSNGTGVSAKVVLYHQELNLSYNTTSNTSGNWNYTVSKNGNYTIFAYLNRTINSTIKTFIGVTS